MIVILASVNAFKVEKFQLSVSTLTGSHEITLTKLIANSPRVLKTYVFLQGRHDDKGAQLLWNLY